MFTILPNGESRFQLLLKKYTWGGDELLPDILTTLLGMSTGSGCGIEVIDPDRAEDFDDLVDANDAGVHFHTIADSIERHYKKRGVL